MLNNSFPLKELPNPQKGCQISKGRFVDQQFFASLQQ